MMDEEARVYEFNFERLNIRHFLTLNRLRGNLDDPQAVEDFVKLGGEFCDFDPLELPFSEFNNFISQLAQAIAIAFRQPPSEELDGG